jgi:hypothetical protein
MPLQYSGPYNPYTEPKSPANWPLIILITLGVVILICVGIYFYINPPASSNNNEPTGETLCGKEDVYNCDDFATQADAQEIYDLCVSEGAGDVHHLDNDGDGKVCESLV